MPAPRPAPAENPRCAAVRAEAFALAEGELSPRAATAVRMHADECPPCREALAGDATFLRWLRANAGGADRDRAAAPPGLRARVRQLLAERAAAPGAPAVGPRASGRSD